MDEVKKNLERVINLLNVVGFVVECDACTTMYACLLREPNARMCACGGTVRPVNIGQLKLAVEDTRSFIEAHA